MLCAAHTVLSATLKLNKINPLKIRQTGQSPSDVQCPIMKSKPALSILLLDGRIMLLKQVTELLIVLQNTEIRSLTENTPRMLFSQVQRFYLMACLTKTLSNQES